MLDYVKNTQGSQAKKWSKNSKLSIEKAIVKETKLNHTRLMKKAKTDKEQAKKDWEKNQK